MQIFPTLHVFDDAIWGDFTKIFGVIKLLHKLLYMITCLATTESWLDRQSNTIYGMYCELYCRMVKIAHMMQFLPMRCRVIAVLAMALCPFVHRKLALYQNNQMDPTHFYGRPME